MRELQNVLRRAILFSDGPKITANMLSLAPSPLTAPAPSQLPDNRELWQIERDAIECTIAACGGIIPKAAKILAVSPSTIYRKRESWGEIGQRLAG